MSSASPQLSLPLPRRAYAGSHLWWHDAIIDEMLAHPDWTKKDIAKKLNCTPQIIYLVTGSDLFRAKFEQRRREFSENHDHAILGKLTVVAEASLDILAQALEKKKDSIPIPILADIADKTLNRLGYGVKPAPSANVQVNVGAQQAVVAVSADDLNEARAALRSAERQRMVGRTVTEGDGAAVERRMVTEGDGVTVAPLRTASEASGAPVQTAAESGGAPSVRAEVEMGHSNFSSAVMGGPPIIEGEIVREEQPSHRCDCFEGDGHVAATVDQL